MRQIMRSSLDYAGFAQLCGRSLIMCKIMCAHNRIIPRSLVSLLSDTDVTQQQRWKTFIQKCKMANLLIRVKRGAVLVFRDLNVRTLSTVTTLMTACNGPSRHRPRWIPPAS